MERLTVSGWRGSASGWTKSQPGQLRYGWLDLLGDRRRNENTSVKPAKQIEPSNLSESDQRA
jgi:hypothetical protein